MTIDVEACKRIDAKLTAKAEKRSHEIVCPFCGEGDFDLIGLKLHYLRGHCDVFEATPLKD